MKQINQNKNSNTSKMSYWILNLKRSMCFSIRSFIRNHTKGMCFSLEEHEEILEQTRITIDKEHKFNVFEKIAPDILRRIHDLETLAQKEQQMKDFCIEGIKQIYIADINNDAARKKELFAQFGLPMALEKKDV